MLYLKLVAFGNINKHFSGAATPMPQVWQNSSNILLSLSRFLISSTCLHLYYLLSSKPSYIVNIDNKAECNSCFGLYRLTAQLCFILYLTPVRTKQKETCEHTVYVWHRAHILNTTHLSPKLNSHSYNYYVMHMHLWATCWRCETLCLTVVTEWNEF